MTYKIDINAYKISFYVYKIALGLVYWYLWNVLHPLPQGVTLGKIS